MRMRLLSHVLAAGALVAAPVAASAQPAANPAASLSVAKSVRAGTPTAKKSELFGGGGVIAAILFAAIVAIPIIAVVNDSNDPDSP